jgi:nucleoside-specific outer membrane channel protein Tsx
LVLVAPDHSQRLEDGKRPTLVRVIVKRLIVGTVFLVSAVLLAPAALAQNDQGFSTSRLTVRYGSNFTEPGIEENVPKNIFTFDNAAAGRWWSSYLFVDVLRSWSGADANAKEVYGEWYPTVSLRALLGRDRLQGLLGDVGLTVGLNSGVRSTGPSPFAVLPGLTFSLNVPGFTFFSVGTFAYIDRGRFQGQPTDCTATTWQVTPSWSAPFGIGAAKFQTEGFVDFIGRHANCAAWIMAYPRLMLDLSGLWQKPGTVYVGVDFGYWRNKYGISGLEDKQFLPVLVWVI